MNLRLISLHRRPAQALLATIFLGAFALPAAAYDIDLQRELSGMKVTLDATGGPNAKVVINNKDKVSAHCRVEFQGGKGANAVRAGVVKAGKRLILTAPMPPELEKLRINATCKPPKGKDAKDSKEGKDSQ